MWKHANILPVFAITLLMFTPVVSAETIEVGANCTYKTIQMGIDAATHGDTVKVHPGTYQINSAIVAKNDIEIAGSVNGRTIIYTDSFDDINSESNPAMIYLNGAHGVTIRDIVFQGPARNTQHQHQNGGRSEIGGLREARNGIKIEKSDDVEIYNCKFTLLLSDGIRSTESSNITVENCIFQCAGHDSISLYKTTDVDIDNNVFDLMINTCIRVYNSGNCSVTNNTFTQTTRGTGAGYIELEGWVHNTTINHNVFMQSIDPVMWIAYGKGGDIKLSDNILYNVPNLSDTYAPYTVTTEKNYIYDENKDWASMGYGYNTSHKAWAPAPRPGGGSRGNEDNDESIETIEYDDTTNMDSVEFGIKQMEIAKTLTISGIDDLTRARNGTITDEQYKQSCASKIRNAIELLEMSLNAIGGK